MKYLFEKEFEGKRKRLIFILGWLRLGMIFFCFFLFGKFYRMLYIVFYNFRFMKFVLVRLA